MRLLQECLRQRNKFMKTDILIVGCGVSGLYCALNLPRNKNITVITKVSAEESDSFLAQGGICVLKSEDDYDSFFEDTMRAGHYENNPESVDIMIRSSREVIADLAELGASFEKDGDSYAYTREGAHSKPRILFHEDETGKEITSHLLEAVRKLDNVTLIEHYTMIDIICSENECFGIVGRNSDGEYSEIFADYTVLATGGIGGLFEHSTNFRHLTGDSLAVALKHDIKLRHIDYIQIHPTTFYSEGTEERKFLVSESVRGEGAVLLNSKGERFVNELLPRDVVTAAIYKEMEREGTKHVRLSLAAIPEDTIKAHFPNIYKYCKDSGYDITQECIPVVPAQHYFMGGIDVDKYSKTSMNRLYAVGETACNGVHGKNRLASNSLLESLVFAKRAAHRIAENYLPLPTDVPQAPEADIYENYEADYRAAVLSAIEKEKQSHE